MTDAKFKKLFLWEVRNMPRRGLLWVVVGILFASFTWGAFNAAALHRNQSSSMATNLKADADWRANVRRDVARYARPSNEILQYWQDPTDIDGFSRYFLRESATKPDLPLTALSVGQSDLLPFFFPMKLETPFGVEPAYDFEHPRALALGLFDMAFAIVYFLPIGVILLVTMIGAFERDHGILRLAASQAVSPRMLLGSKLLALAAWLVPLLLLAVVVALGLAGAPLLRDLPGLGAALLIVCAYALFWFTLSWLVLSYQKGASASASIMIAIWAMFAIVIPKAATFGTALFVPQGSYVQYINELRTAESDVMQGGRYWQGSMQYWLDSRPEPQARMIDTTKQTYAAHLVFAAPERERRLRATVDNMAEEHRKAGRWTIFVELLSPPAALQDTLSTLSGNDARRHERFIQSVKAYQSQLRSFIYPRIERQILSPAISTCVNCPGRFSFTEQESVPTYRFPEQTLVQRVGPALLWTVLLGLVSAAMSVLALRRGRNWRSGELQ